MRGQADDLDAGQKEAPVTASDDELRYEQHLDKMQSRLPRRAARAASWLRRREMRPFRVCAAVLLMVGGLAGFLPVLGFWMLPLGMLLLAQDVPPLQRISVRMLAWIERWSRRASVVLKRSAIGRRFRHLFRQS